MYLTLEVISSQAVSMGAASRREVGPQGLTIGRAPDNDWVLPDPYISKQHARIGFADGQFFVEGIGKNPIALGTSQNIIPPRQPQPLREGDRIFIDQYEVLVTLVQDEQATIPELPIEAQATERLLDVEEEIDRMDLRASRATGSHPVRVPPAFEHEATVPEVPLDSWPPAPPPPERVPDRAAERRRTAAPMPGPGAPSSSGNNPRPAQPPARTPRPSQGPAPEPPRAPPPSRTRPIQQAPAPGPGETGAYAAAASPSSTGRSRAMPEAGGEGGGRLSNELLTLLRAAGVSERDWTPELAEELGQVLRISVEGVMEMLRGRAEIKAQFQLPLTRVQVRENNPLKLMPNIEAVLNALLVQRNRAYMPTMQAFKDAIDDIRNHQAALLVGLRAAFDSLLGHFEPEQLQREFDMAGRRPSWFGGKSGYWDQYVARFEQLGHNPEDTFRRLCGEVFAEAYEHELERLKTQGDPELPYRQGNNM